MRTDPEQRTLRIGSREIRYQLSRSPRKKLRITVTPALEVLVYAPIGAEDDAISEAVQEKARWIVRRLNRVSQYHPLPTPLKYVSGETLVYLGRQYRLKVMEGGRQPAKLRGKFLEVTVPRKTDSAAVQKAVERWYRIRAKEVFDRYLTSSLQVASRHGVPTPGLQIRKMRTRWGSCSPGGRITLNLNLVQVPVHCVEYVIMHELCHLVHHDHSPSFFRLLSRCMPDWEKRKRVLDGIAVA